MIHQQPEKDVRTLDVAQKALSLLDEGHQRWDLPIPWDVEITRGSISFAFDSVADVAEWAKHLDTVVHEVHDHGKSSHQYAVDGTTQGVKIHLWAVGSITDF